MLFPPMTLTLLTETRIPAFLRKALCLNGSICHLTELGNLSYCKNNMAALSSGTTPDCGSWANGAAEQVRGH